MSKGEEREKEEKKIKRVNKLTVDESLKIIESSNEATEQNIKKTYNSDIQSRHRLGSYFCYNCGSVLTTKADLEQHLIHEREKEKEDNNH